MTLLRERDPIGLSWPALPITFGTAFAWELASLVLPVGVLVPFAGVPALGLHCRWAYELGRGEGARAGARGAPLTWFPGGAALLAVVAFFSLAALFLGWGGMRAAPFEALLPLASVGAIGGLPVLSYSQGRRIGALSPPAGSTLVAVRPLAALIAALVAPAVAIIAFGIVDAAAS